MNILIWFSVVTILLMLISHKLINVYVGFQKNVTDLDFEANWERVNGGSPTGGKPLLTTEKIFDTLENVERTRTNGLKFLRSYATKAIHCTQ